MENTSPFLAMQRMEAQLKGLLRNIDTELLTAAEQKAVAAIKRLMVDARLDIRDYELSETRVEQLQNAETAKKRIATLQSHVLEAGAVFGPADVAQIGGQLEQIHAWLL
jgi:hypothetical protein